MMLLRCSRKRSPPEASFLQVEVTAGQMRARALSMINALRRTSSRPEIDFIALSLRGKKIGFEKVLKMIDDLVAQLKTEQKDDDEKKEYCADEFDKADDKKKDDDEKKEYCADEFDKA